MFNKFNIIFFVPLLFVLIPLVPLSINGTPDQVFQLLKALLFSLGVFIFILNSKLNNTSFYISILLFFIGLISSFICIYYYKISINLITLISFFIIFCSYSIHFRDDINIISTYALKILSLISVILAFYFLYFPSIQFNLYSWNSSNLEFSQQLFFFESKLPISIYGLYTLSSSIYFIFSLFWLHQFYLKRSIWSILNVTIFLFFLYDTYDQVKSLQALLCIMLFSIILIIYFNDMFLKNKKLLRIFFFSILLLIASILTINFFDLILTNDGLTNRFSIEDNASYLYNALNFIFLGLGYGNIIYDISGIKLSLGDMNQADLIIRFSLIGLLLYYCIIYFFLKNNLHNIKFLVIPLFVSIFLMDLGHSVSRSIHFLPIFYLYIISINKGYMQ